MGALLRASDCCLLIVSSGRLADLHCRDAELDPRRRIETVIEAAALLAIPVLVATGEPEHSKCAEIRWPGSLPPAASIAVPSGNADWRDTDLGKTILETKRACLVLAGWWLESDVTFVALEAGAYGLDTFLLADAVLCFDEAVRRPAICRLSQSGVMPASTPQIVAEWARFVDDAQITASLKLLATTSRHTVNVH